MYGRRVTAGLVALVFAGAGCSGASPAAGRPAAGAPAVRTTTAPAPVAGAPNGPAPVVDASAVPSARSHTTRSQPERKAAAAGGPTQPEPGLVTAGPTAVPTARATLAFGGDVHFEGVSRSGLTGDLGSGFDTIATADAGFVNLETAVTDRGTPGPKLYTFRAPARAMTVLRSAGVDAVTMANNHGEDYGPVGLRDSLAAAAATRLTVVGAGVDDAAAYTPWRASLHGIRVAVFGATDVLDDYAVSAWPATRTRPGLASAKQEQRLLTAVRSERARSDVVVVFLHWGVERVVCPTARQQQLARELAAAGASLIVGSHAHVLQPEQTVAGIPVFYGLGNFHFYARGGAGSVSGIATATIGPHGVVSTGWVPARIVSGAPQLVTGEAARTERAAFGELCR